MVLGKWMKGIHEMQEDKQTRGRNRKSRWMAEKQGKKNTYFPNLMVKRRYSKGPRPSILISESRASPMNFLSLTAIRQLFASLCSIVLPRYPPESSMENATEAKPSQVKDGACSRGDTQGENSINGYAGKRRKERIEGWGLRSSRRWTRDRTSDSVDRLTSWHSQNRLIWVWEIMLMEQRRKTTREPGERRHDTIYDISAKNETHPSLPHKNPREENSVCGEDKTLQEIYLLIKFQMFNKMVPWSSG